MVSPNHDIPAEPGPPLEVASIKRTPQIIEIRCPQELSLDSLTGHPSLFIAGGIGIGTGLVGDWQQRLIHELLADLDLLAINPRRAHFPAGEPQALREQVSWEYRGLHAAQAISFWLPANYSCPITLYELGTWSIRAKPLFVGIDPGYPHRDSLIPQLAAVRPALCIVDTIERLAENIRNWRAGTGRIDMPEGRPVYSPKSVFIGGGIADCPDWQAEITEMVRDVPAVFVDPRDRSLNRELLSPAKLRELSARNQKKLLGSEGFCMWFPKESKSPTSLFELGAIASMVERPLFVGAHPEYFRSADVRLQIGLTRPEVRVAATLSELAEQVRNYYRMR